MSKNEEGSNLFSIDLKNFLIGGLYALLWASLFVAAGAIWSIRVTEKLNFFDHLHNGLVFAFLMNVLALLGGASIGVAALYGLSKDRKTNFKILGFVLTHVCVVAAIWNFGSGDFRRDEKPKSKIEQIFELKDRLQKSE